MVKKSKFQSPIVLVCDCSSSEHNIIISYDEEDNLAYCHIHLAHKSLLQRIVLGVRYIFGYKCAFGNYQEFIFTHSHAEKLKKLSELLEKNKDKNTVYLMQV